MTESAEVNLLEFLRAMRAELNEKLGEIITRLDLVDARFDAVDARLDSMETFLAGAVASAAEALGIAERLKARVKRLEDPP